MPNGCRNFSTNTSVVATFPLSSCRSTLMRPGPLSTTNKSPFGAVMILRGLLNFSASKSTSNPAGAFNAAPSGRRTMCGPLSTDFVANGAGKSFVVSIRRTPGASVLQSPSASAPVRSGCFRSAAPAASAAAIIPTTVARVNF
jgi:hypothetical protein